MNRKELYCFVNVSCIVAVILLVAACASNDEVSSDVATAYQPSYSEQAIIRNGTPELAFGDSGYATLNVAYTKYEGEPAMRFNVFDEPIFAPEPAYLYITPDKIILVPNNEYGSSQSTSFDYSKSAVSRFIASDSRNDFDAGLFTDHNGTMLVVSGSEETSKYYLWITPTGIDDNLRGHLPGADADRAMTTYASWINMAWSDFPGAVNEFVRMTANVSTPLTTVQSTQIAALEQEADTASANGQYANALSNCVAALQVLPTQWAPQDIVQQLQRKSIEYALRLNPPPSVPSDALRHEVYGKTAISNAQSAADLEQGIQEFTQAVRLAPWWADGYYNLAVAQEKAKRYSRAADNLQDYLLAKPGAPDAKAVQMKIYSLQYEAAHGGN